MMMKKFFIVLSLLSFWCQQSALACGKDGSSGIVEDNDLHIGINDKTAGGISEKTFQQVISDIESIYAPHIRKMGRNLKINRDWTDGTVNAFALQPNFGNTWEVTMVGGLARHPAITPDGFALVLCHEIGHHLGGAPKKQSINGNLWASNEGQADYWGTLKCMRKYMQNQDNLEKIEQMSIPANVKLACEKQFTNPGDEAICQRTAMAGLSLGNLFRSLRGMSTILEFQNRDLHVVGQTFDGHPMPQCRLDTYFAGSLCSVDSDVEVSNRDANQGVCSREEGYRVGPRPLCWYHP